MAEEKRSAEELAELQEPNSMSGCSERVRAMGPGFGDRAFARPSDESNTDPEVEAFAFERDEDEDRDESKDGDK